MIDEPSKQNSGMNVTRATPPAQPEGAAPAKARGSTGRRGIFLIAVFDLLKAVLFLVGAAAVFHLVDRNTRVELTRLLHVFRINGDHAFIRNLLLKANLITDPSKRIFADVLLLYAMLYAVEGIGLLLRKRWAEYFAVLMTVIPLPFEAYALFHHATLLHNRLFALKLAVLFINVGIVWFLVYHLRRGGKPGVVGTVDQS